MCDAKTADFPVTPNNAANTAGAVDSPSLVVAQSGVMTCTHQLIHRANRRLSPRLGIRGALVWHGLGVLLLASGCGSAGTFVWVDAAPEVYFRPAPRLLIRAGDTISVRVFGQEALSVRVKVRTDGVIAMPLIGYVPVSGKDTEAIAKEVEQRLRPFVTTPNVIATIEESNVQIAAIGEVRRNGTIILDGTDTRLFVALANAGGLTEFADESRIFVIRTDATGQYRIRFQYEDVIRGIGRAATFRLQDGDQLVVE